MPLVWNDSYSVKVSEIDEQHKKILELINKLQSGLRTAEAEELVPEIIKELLVYVDVHFVSEEKYMQDANYPEYDKHKHSHNLIAEKVSKIQEDSANHKITFKDMLELYLFLQEWLKSHILHEDMLYVPYMKEFHDLA